MSWRRSMKRGEKEERSFAVCFGDAHTHSFARARAPSTGPDLGEIWKLEQTCLETAPQFIPLALRCDW